MLPWRQFSGDGLGFLRGKVSQRELKSNQAGKGLGQWFAMEDCPFLQSPSTACRSRGVWRSSVPLCLCPVLEALPFPFAVTWAGMEPLAPVWAGEFSPLSPREAPGLRCPCGRCVWRCGVPSARLPVPLCQLLLQGSSSLSGRPCTPPIQGLFHEDVVLVQCIAWYLTL